MSVTQPPSDAPFGLQPNVAAGLAYFFTILGGLIFLFGGGTNKFVKWSAAQSITMWVLYIVLYIVVGLLAGMLHLGVLAILFPIIALVWFILFIWTVVTGFQGKEVRIPIISGITESIFKSMI
jgi:uncharacterized membrane protein